MLKIQDIAYWMSYDLGRVCVDFGQINDIDHGIAYIDRLSPRESRRVNGVPIKDVPMIGEWHKLPKGWTYNTRLFELTHDDIPGLKDIHVDVPEEVKKAVEDGILVKADTIFEGNIETEISKEKGFRVILTYPMWERPKLHHVSMKIEKLYDNYAEALAEVNAYKKECERIAALSDRDWSIEQIDHTLDRLRVFESCPEEKIQRYREWLLALDNIEDVETRLLSGDLEWKYVNNQKWHGIKL